MSAEPAAPLVIWALSDGKPGHVNQTRGLVNALADVCDTQAHWMGAPGRLRSLFLLITRRYPRRKRLPKPDLIIGTGHRTHLALLAAGRATGAHTVVLMRPSLPAHWFDLCVVPEHDNVTGDQIIITRGVLNAVLPSAKSDARTGLILIGGISKHFRWVSADVVRAVRDIAYRDRDSVWFLTTSRRTPADVVPALQALGFANLRIIPFDQTDPHWVPQQLARAARVWVTEDSVSMVYEALTAQALVGLIPVPRRGLTRVARGMDSLVRDELVTPLNWYLSGHQMFVHDQPFNEAARVARIILSKWFRV